MDFRSIKLQFKIIIALTTFEEGVIQIKINGIRKGSENRLPQEADLETKLLVESIAAAC